MATIADLNVNIGVSGVQSLDAGLQRASKSVGDLGRETDKAASKIEKASANTSKGFSSIGSSLSGISGAIAGAFTVGAVLQFGSAIIQTTANFQKMEAVLTNSLGSSSAAQNAMLMIQDIAARTPFSVEQLTESFVKLSNRGIVPTGDQIIKLGDLASSTGKDFNQLTEAMLDAMTGEFERLKEFGIQASSQGDKVAFSFKGVTTEVAKTDTAIKDYILSLGDLEGVAGANAAISETLGGQISNLGDSFTSLFRVIGEGTGGVLSSSVKALNFYVQGIANALKSVDQLRGEEIAKRGAYLKEGIGTPKTTEEFAAAQAKLNQEIAHNIGLQEKVKTKIQQIKKASEEAGVINLTGRNFREELEKQSGLIETFQRRIDAAKQTLGGLAEAQKAANAPAKEQITTLETLKAKLKTLQDQQEGMNVSDTKGLITKNQEIQKLEDLIKKYEGLGIAKSKASKFDGPKAQDIRQALAPPKLSNTGALGSDIAMGLPPDFAKRLAAAQAGIVSLKGTMIEMTGFMQSELSNAFMSVGDLIGQAFTGNLGGAEGFFKGVLAIVADFAGQFGKLLIGAGVAALNFKNLLVNPVGAIAAGVALLAISGVIGGMLKKGPSGGGATGGGSYSPPTNRASTPSGLGGGGAVQVTGETRIVGSDIVIAYERAQNNNGRGVR